jgi:glycosyltransferase involved in cell wall biosynthesis
LSTSLRRVAIIGCRGFPSTYGGYETLVRYLARDWVARGLDVTVYCRTRRDRWRWEAEGVQCRWTPGRDTTRLSTLTYGLTSQIDAMFRGFDAALVLNIANGLFLPALRLAGVPVAVNTDGLEWERRRWGPVAKRIFLTGAMATAKFADALIADSMTIAEIWERRFGVRSTFVPYGAPVLEDAGSDRVLQLGLEPRSYVLVVARLIPENNVELVLDALDRMDPRIPAVIVGSASHAPPVEARLKRLDACGAVRWLGHVHDQELLEQLWANCGIYVHGHSAGGTNPALLQALGAGAPTIALSTRFNREVVGRPDQLFEPDAASLAARIRAILDDRPLADELSASGKRLVAERYSWPDVADRYLAALESARAKRH